MKLNEIVISDTSKNDFEVTPAVQSQLDALAEKGKKLIQLNSKTELVNVGNFYAAVREGKTIGWIELSDQETIHNKKYQVIKFIYFIPQVRKTIAVGAFLIGLRKVLKMPIILGSSGYGGVLFSDGANLVKSLKGSALADVKILNLKTGETREVTDPDLEKTSKGLTLVFEDDEFPLYQTTSIGNIYMFENSEKPYETS